MFHEDKLAADSKKVTALTLLLPPWSMSSLEAGSMGTSHQNAIDLGPQARCPSVL